MEKTDMFSSGGGTSDSWTKTQRAASPVSSCVSMKSEQSMGNPLDFSNDPVLPDPGTKTQRAASPVSSCVSMKSDESMGNPLDFSNDPVLPDPGAVKGNTHISREKLESIFKELELKVISLVKDELKRFKKLLGLDSSACSEKEMEDEDDQRSGREGALKITLHILRSMKQTDLANTLQRKLAPACHKKLKSKLKNKYENINEGFSEHGKSALLNEIYTELYITEGGSGEVNNEHEVRQIETASRRTVRQETPIKCNDIFKPLPGQSRHIRSVLTKGIAGIGKTVSVQKFILDWTEGKVNQDILFIFPLPFRELTLIKKKQCSLVKLLHEFFPETQKLKPRHYSQYKIMFIFDGLDECRLPLDFKNNENLVDIEKSASVDVLLTNLIKGNLLPSALLWITTRPAAANQIPPECVDQVTEVRGFSDPQKEEYFRKRISDHSMAKGIITHMKSSRSLFIMCHIPVFCWITATVLERMICEAESGEIPKTLTQMFTHFLIFQIKHSQKYEGKSDTDPHKTRESVLTLAKLAFQHLEKGNLIFYEEDLRNSGIDVREVSVYSGVCTQIFREEFGHLGKVFSFVHLSIQEFLAALYVFISFIANKRNVLEQQTTGVFSVFKKSTMSDFLKSAVDKALKSENGQLDFFLRFLLGLSLESNQSLLRGFLTQTGTISHSNEEVVKYIKEKIKENPSPEKTINLFHCLNELNDHSLVQEVQTYLSRGGGQCLYKAKLSPAQWSALAFVLLNSEEELDVFDLSKYDPSEECFLKLLSVVKASRKAVLTSCNLGIKSCENLGSVLQSANCSLRELDLSHNELQDSGVKLLSDGLKSSHCKLETLSLSACLITEEGCSSLALALSSNPSHLKELDLTYNHPGDSGVKLLSARLEDPHCRLETLRLTSCNLRIKSCENLGSVLQSANCSLRELNLSHNELQDSGVKLLSDGLKSSHCKLETLSLSACLITEEGCSSLASALSSNPSHLKELDLTYNHPGDSGVKLLSARLEDPHCRLEKIRLTSCNLGMKSCENLGSVLQSANCSLRELDLSHNDLQDSGVKLLSDGLKSSHCKLETLSLSACMITEEGCSSLASALSSNPSHLKELNLTYNHPGDSGVKLLSARLEDPHYRLETLKLEHAGCIRLKPGLKKYFCHLTLNPNTANHQLSLSENNRVVRRSETEQRYSDHPERFDCWPQVLCEESVCGRCYWEVEWSRWGCVFISVSYKEISRKGRGDECVFGRNNQSWNLLCSDTLSFWHNNIKTEISESPSSRIGVYVDHSAGTLSFYRVSDTMTLLHRVHTTFTQPLYAGFGFWVYGSTVRLCDPK